MARAVHTQLPQPVFPRTDFRRRRIASRSDRFSTAHPSDNALYKQIGDLTKTDVVAVPESRIAANEMFGLAEAYGSHGSQITKIIEDAGKIIFHAFGRFRRLQLGENMPTNCASAIRLRSIARLRRKATGLRFSFTSVMSSTISASAILLRPIFTTLPQLPRSHFCDSGKITIHSWFRERRQATRRWTRSAKFLFQGTCHYP